MLKIDPQSRRFVSIRERTLEPAGFCSRYSLADFIANSPETFFEEAGRRWLLLGRDWETNPGGRRAELVAADAEGRLYVIATQRGQRTPDLMEPLETASRLASWTARQAGRRLDEPMRARLLEFLEVPAGRLNAEQGVALIAESFDVDTLATGGWMRERYGVRVTCLRVRSARDSLTGLDYLVCQDLDEAMSAAYRKRKTDAADAAPWPTVFPVEGGAPATEPPAPERAKTPEPDWSAALESTLEKKPEATREAAEAEAPAEPQPASPETASAAAAAAERAGEGEEELSHLEEVRDDPLAELVKAHEGAADEPEDSGDGKNRRRSERRRDFHARRLRLDYLGRLLGARLVDVSEHGIGVEALSPLPVGSEVGISGELVGRDSALGIEGRVRVEHCRANPDGVCRIGFSIENASVRPIEPDEQAFDRR